MMIGPFDPLPNRTGPVLSDYRRYRSGGRFSRNASQSIMALREERRVRNRQMAANARSAEQYDRRVPTQDLTSAGSGSLIGPLDIEEEGWV